ncbi:MAG: response regulator transcription factor [Verrucomicrobia bacterium]|nr:MAG: response regulator transcription factor [Verrucomicrobiota bacterium]
MMGEHAVLVLDDDRFIRTGLDRLLAAHGYKVILHAEPDELFRDGMPKVPACLLLDNQLGEGMTGVEVHEELLRRGWFIPTVFLTAHWNVQLVVNAIRAGADGFLTKPFDPSELVDAVALALQRSRDNRQEGFVAAEARVCVASLTPRERDIVRLVVEGMLNKEIADQLNLALITVKVHRGRAMRKLAAGNPAEMVHIAELGGIGR